MNASDEYVTPGTSTEVTVAGVSSSGSAADIPGDLTYTVTNGTYANGVLTAGEAGDVVLTAVHGGREVGSLTIHAVIPSRLPSLALRLPYLTERQSLSISRQYSDLTMLSLKPMILCLGFRMPVSVQLTVSTLLPGTVPFRQAR